MTENPRGADGQTEAGKKLSPNSKAPKNQAAANQAEPNEGTEIEDTWDKDPRDTALKNKYLQIEGRKDDLPQESADALMNSVANVVREEAGIEISLRREMVPTRENNLSMLVVTLPEGVTPQQRAETDYWLNEMAGLYRYAGE